MNSNDGMILWILGGAGVFLLYSAYVNQEPQALLASQLEGTAANAPISNYTGSRKVATATTPDGKTHNTEPGDGGYITGDPPSSRLQEGYTPGGIVPSGYRQDISGTYNMVDSTGRLIGVIPNQYQRTPQLYIPPVSA